MQNGMERFKELVKRAGRELPEERAAHWERILRDLDAAGFRDLRPTGETPGEIDIEFVRNAQANELADMLEGELAGTFEPYKLVWEGPSNKPAD